MAVLRMRWGRPRPETLKPTAPESWETLWAFRVEKTHAHPSGADLSYGIRGTSRAVTVYEVTDLLVTETRAAHSHHPGKITVSVWRTYDLADSVRRPRATGPVPPDAHVTIHP